eukprot:TRINITY_DN587_c0_g2_i1.p1 TRINITY_DN587_c0_g2~~TRINITY_DN587_c0_g2_i1.p1  ORF type:complete len:291 (+),score=100.22 TRINITY_DN587_c0_g2_i1:177-1049(+)
MKLRILLLVMLALLLLAVNTQDTQQEEEQQDEAADNLEEPNMELLNDQEEQAEEREQEEEIEREKEEEKKEEKPVQEVRDKNEDQVESSDEKDYLMEQWNTHMSDFTPSDMVTFELPGNEEEVFYEKIDTVPSRIRGAYFVSSSENSDIDFVITDPKGDDVFEKLGKKESIFYFNTTKKGVYQFKFSNQKFFETKQVTFALHASNNTNTPVKSADIDPLNERLYKITQSIGDIHVETKFSYKRAETHLATIKGTHARVFLFTILESLGIIVTSLWQIYYIKKLLDNKRII